MSSRKIHRRIGLILILPMLGWALTGIVFFIKPGYSEAYEQLVLKTYPVETQLTIVPENKWEKVTLIKTILGHHLLVSTGNKLEHLDPTTFEEKSFPSSSQFKRLVADAISGKNERYGDIVSINDNHVQTSTGVEIELDWLNLKLRQKGDDTKLINLLYKIHYLQWTPFKGVNQLLGIIGLLLLISLTVFGLTLYVKNREK
ncbi:PepSY domain-containing protein [Colwellia sp. MSW7]|uniref:PepSY domain-containing protein n=1 Tax=Colwellia maritima TaxID=2912588 RepID=A0ABS9X1Q7_9GAMM|nr:PepSY domain-containing protein [Colwellia maritima]MCI2284180.1 PepSY domain-containing protein [Colwellia maritima]